MSKKLIAVASAAALALTALVGVAPASATASTITFTANGGGSGTAVAPYLSAVPQTNTLVDATALKIVVANVAAGDTVSVTATAPAKIVDAEITAASTLVNVTTLGSTSASTTLTSGTSATFWVYTTSSTVTSDVTVSVRETDSGVTTTRSTSAKLKGVAGAAYNLTNVTVPATVAAAADADITFNVTDAFGNVLEANVAAAVSATSGPTIAASGAATWDATRKLHVAKVTGGSTADPFVVTIDGNGSTTNPSNIGLGKSTMSTSLVVNSSAVSAQVAALTAQVAALTADYNALVKKWNKRVASKTAPKKKAALK